MRSISSIIISLKHTLQRTQNLIKNINTGNYNLLICNTRITDITLQCNFRRTLSPCTIMIRLQRSNICSRKSRRIKSSQYSRYINLSFSNQISQMKTLNIIPRNSIKQSRQSKRIQTNRNSPRSNTTLYLKLQFLQQWSHLLHKLTHRRSIRLILTLHSTHTHQSNYSRKHHIKNINLPGTINSRVI